MRPALGIYSHIFLVEALLFPCEFLDEGLDLGLAVSDLPLLRIIFMLGTEVGLDEMRVDIFQPEFSICLQAQFLQTLRLLLLLDR